jgi:hypothetical protein
MLGSANDENMKRNIKFGKTILTLLKSKRGRRERPFWLVQEAN